MNIIQRGLHFTANNIRGNKYSYNSTMQKYNRKTKQKKTDSNLVSFNQILLF